MRADHHDCSRAVRFRVGFTLAPAKNFTQQCLQYQNAKGFDRRFSFLTARAYPQGGYETSQRASRVAPSVEKVIMGAVKQLLEAE